LESVSLLWLWLEILKQSTSNIKKIIAMLKILHYSIEMFLKKTITVMTSWPRVSQKLRKRSRMEENQIFPNKSDNSRRILKSKVLS